MSWHWMQTITSAVDVPAVTDPERENDEPVVPDQADDPVVLHAVAPEPCEIRLQRLAETPRVELRFDLLLEEQKNLSSDLGRELAEFLRRPNVELNVPHPVHSEARPVK